MKNKHFELIKGVNYCENSPKKSSYIRKQYVDLIAGNYFQQLIYIQIAYFLASHNLLKIIKRRRK